MILVACGAFKGSLTASEACEAVAAGLRQAHPGLPIEQSPVADGGDGTLDALTGAGFNLRPVRVRGPLGGWHTAAIATRGEVAVVELASACGLALLPPGGLRPMTATTMGAGDALRQALTLGYRQVVLGLGGSASTDGGAGMLQALGALITDPGGAPVGPGASGIARAAAVDLRPVAQLLGCARITLATDVDSPLLGPAGAAKVFGPQKGMTGRDVATAERALATWADVLEAACAPHGHQPARWRCAPGAGAAGGAGFAALAALGAQRSAGFEVVAHVTGLERKVAGARLVITGEGRLDAQTLRGKAPGQVARIAARAGRPCIAICGSSRLSEDEWRAAGFTGCLTLAGLEPDERAARAAAASLLSRVSANLRLPV